MGWSPTAKPKQLENESDDYEAMSTKNERIFGREAEKIRLEVRF